ncbi:MAG: radical SAM family heme chaperone HemW [Treponema sp.]
MQASLYIHIPFCARRCAYCDFFSTVQKDASFFKPYINCLLQDIQLFKELYSIDYFNTVYIGGGTPTLLLPEDIFHLASSITKSQKEKIKEFTIEGNPEDITQEHLIAFFKGGINRLSLGIQSFSNYVLKNENRRGSKKQTLKALEKVSLYWKGILSLDFIAGLHGQTCNSLLEDLKIASKIAPEHISLYELVSHYKQDEKTEMYNAKMWESGARYLEKENYIRYEVSNFSYNGQHECLHNLVYWNLDNYVGIGAGGTGNIINEDISGVRFTGITDLQHYLKIKDRKKAYQWENVSKMDMLKDTIMMAFRLTKGLDRDRFNQRFGFDIVQMIPNTIEKWLEKKLLKIDKNFVTLERKGLFLLNSFLCEAFAELERTFAFA